MEREKWFDSLISNPEIPNVSKGCEEYKQIKLKHDDELGELLSLYEH